VRFRGNDVPHFRFAAAAGSLFMFCGVRIVGVDLDGQFVVGKEEFQEQWKVVVAGRASATPVEGHGAPGVAQGSSGEGARRHTGLERREPRFAQRFGEIRFVGE
jgi:hypothetical protein